MHRCHIEPSGWNDKIMTLSPAESHHLVDVMRARDGETVAVFDGRGRKAVARLVLKGERAAAQLQVSSAGSDSRSGGVEVVLIQAIPKGSKMDMIVEKAVELGVSAIWPVMTERTIVRLNSDEARRNRSERWQRLALSASRQCGTSWIPDVEPVADIGDAFARCDGFDLFLSGSLEKDAIPLREVLSRRTGAAPRRIGLLIGPEGDLTSAELAAARNAGAIPVSFGSLVLRVDTAAIFGLSVLASEFAR
ncbi:MAG: 16S rRNA methyltransferase [Verrucomicrobia bacterium]|nr:16S rRNA methyltransferase [Verrucomicrobiota bacterium]